MKSARWEGHATALSSIAHGGETLGTVTYLRREAFLTPDGRTDIPVISGNAVRGALRDAAATMLWEALGQPRLPLAVMHALWAGGALAKTRTQPLTGQRLADLRAMVAHIGVFGTAGGGRIIDGALTVGKLVPVCTQTAHLLPDHLTNETLPNIHDLLQIEWYSRIPDAERLPEITGPLTEDDNPEDGLMRYGAETFIAGTKFHAMFALTNATDTEHGFFTEVLNAWTPQATVGGKIGRGHGRLSFALTHTGHQPNPTELTDPTTSAPAAWRTFNNTPTDEVVRALTWLD